MTATFLDKSVPTLHPIHIKSRNWCKHVVNGVYLLHGHFKTKFTRLKLEFDNEQEFYDYLKKHELHFEESKQLSFFEV
ncbi:SAV1978 family virulence-associated passenger protein [Staphylococcus pseudintermedius]|uniref:SAV1978 family virulence-associated passenger protein n=1 Tax=Staphylococcus pseudintermedius TaxID=283734 RepID=UPI00286E37A2|nr:SAV1978 family virulence-associated passenger protein [Staphylococcus pseudintermedius]WMZ46872.1 SAV1978 family virulence-associated passenger protein [Staphylococcus pseudintermedius]